MNKETFYFIALESESAAAKGRLCSVIIRHNLFWLIVLLNLFPSEPQTTSGSEFYYFSAMQSKWDLNFVHSLQSFMSPRPQKKSMFTQDAMNKTKWFSQKLFWKKSLKFGFFLTGDLSILCPKTSFNLSVNE